MARPGPSRPLSLTEELEKLEQSITLTLQEIDSNFNKAHRIVTSSILPIVEQYAKHSNDVWEGSKFWKQFFEASANVSLSGYEEAALEEEDTTAHTETTSTDLSTPVSRADFTPQKAVAQEAEEDESFSVDSPAQVTGTQSTPRLQSSSTQPAAGAGADSRSALAKSTAALRSPSPRKYTGRNPLGKDQRGGNGDEEDQEPSTPRPQTQSQTNLQSSPFEPESAYQPSTARNARVAVPASGARDPIMHRGVLDKNYRIQATPHTQRRAAARPAASAQTPATATKNAKKNLWDDSPQSSPEMAAPQLRADLFSPDKASNTAAAGARARGAAAGQASTVRTPGVSVLTPARNKTGREGPRGGGMVTSTGRRLFSPEDKTYRSAAKARLSRGGFGFSSDDEEDGNETANVGPAAAGTPGNTAEANQSYYDDDGEGEGQGYGYEEDTTDTLGAGLSPPKTLQFHVPQSRLLQTPAREASRRIVQDLLFSAGGAGAGGGVGGAGEDLTGASLEEDEYEIEFGEEDEDEGEVSPSLVRARVGDDTF